MEKIVGNFFIENTDLIPVNEFPETDNNSTIVYEVIRVENLVPLFYEKHFVRLKNSVELADFVTKINNTRMFIQIERLITENNIANGNIKIGLLFNKTGKLQSTKLYFIPHSYPCKEEYAQGIKLILHKAERKNPNVKYRNRELRNKTNELITENNVFEILLYNSKNIITEGSRSNIFFIKENTVYTAPQNLILKGITWEFIVDICKKQNIRLIEKEININEIMNYDSAFLTGTSPKIIKINSINNKKFTNNKLINIIANEYNKIISVYTEKFTRCRI